MEKVLKYSVRFAVLIAGLAAISGCSQSPEEKAQEVYGDGLKKIARFDYAEADSSFTQLTSEQPSSLYGPLGRAQVLERQLQYYDALELYMMVYKTQPSFEPVYAPMARLYTKIGDHEQAWRVLDEYMSMRKDSVDSEILYAITHSALLTGRIPQTTRYVTLLNEQEPNSPAVYFLRAQVAFLFNRPNVADSLAQVGLDNLKNDAQGAYQGANYFETRDQHDSAMTYSRLAVEWSKQDFELAVMHFLRALRVGYLYDARQVLDNIREKDEIGITAHGLSMFYYWAVGDAYRANHHNTEFHKLAPNSYSTYFFDIESRWMLSDVISSRGNVEYINTMMARRGAAQPFVDYFRGRMVLAYSKVFEPETDVQSIRNSPGWKYDQLEYKMQELYYFAISGQKELFDETVGIYNQYRGANAEWLAALGNLFANPKLGMLDSSITYYRRALKHGPSNRGAFTGLLFATSAVHGIDSGLRLFAEFPYFEQLFPTLAISKASMLAIAKRHSEALSLFQLSVPAVQGNPQWFVRMAEEFDRQGEFPLTEKVFELLVSLEPKNPDALTAAARYNADRGNFSQARVLSEEGLKIEPGYPPLEIIYARAQFATGEKDEAIRSLERIIESVDGDVEANIYLSQMVATEGKDPIRAENLARNATFHANSSLRSILNVMEIYSINKNYLMLRGEATKLIQNNPVHPLGFYYLGVAAKQEGKGDKAREYLQYSLDLGLVGPKGDSAKAMLQGIQG